MRGLLLLNLGTPESTDPSAVRRYLREFLSDPRVIDIHPIARSLLLNVVILPFRPRKSAEAYRKVWTERGSPLLFHSRDLAAKVQERLGDGWSVELGMRYGEPSTRDALARLHERGASPIVVLPLYPQYATASTGSSLQHVYTEAGKLPVTPILRVVPDFYDDPAFLDAVAAVSQPKLEAAAADHVLFSFHGIPERHVQATDFSGSHCLASASCCDAIGPANRSCYRAQCYATARGLAERFGLAKDAWSVSFQSRLGRTPWIQPFTDEVIPELPKRGVSSLAVLCPSFTADCLETLEEMGIRGAEDFRSAGGERFTLLPCVNSDDSWADGVATLARRAAGSSA